MTLTIPKLGVVFCLCRDRAFDLTVRACLLLNGSGAMNGRRTRFDRTMLVLVPMNRPVVFMLLRMWVATGFFSTLTSGRR